MTQLEALDIPAVRTRGRGARLTSLVSSQRRNLQTLSALVVINFTIMGLGFLTRVKIANTIGKADFGLFAYGFAIAAYGGAVVRFGLDRTLLRYLIHSPQRQGQIILSSLVLRGALLLVVAAGMLLWKVLSHRAGDLTWGVVLIVMGQSMLGLELKAVYDSRGKMALHAVYNLIQYSLYLLGVWTVIGLAPKRLSVLTLGALMVASSGLYLALQCVWVFRRVASTRVHLVDAKAALALARRNLVICASCLGGLTIAVFNQLTLKTFFGREALGGYAAAWQIASISLLLFDQVGRIGNPAAVRVTAADTSRKARCAFLAKYSLVMFATALPISAAAIAWPEQVLALVYNPEYVSAAGTLRVMGTYMLVYSLGLVASQYVIALEKDRYYLVGILVGGAVSVVLCLTLIPAFKEVGAVVALLVAHTCSILIYFSAVIKDVLGSR